jgi:transcriptional regulator with XRE-family HTH domain
MKKWSELRSRIPVERRQATDQKVVQAAKEMPLHRLREARRLTQKQMAEAMHIDQSRVSKIERRTDVYVSTLRNFVSALGGELELVARFPDGRVRISSFSDADRVGTVEEEAV